MRRVLIVLLGFGVLFGYGSAFASARWHWRAHHGGGCENRWGQRYDDRFDRNDFARPVAAPPPAAPAPAPSQQIFLVMPGAQAPAAAPQIITLPAQAAPAAAPAPVTP
ncbi:MAG TPA: hypothetical protein VGE37_00325 [Archangium sp.]